MNLGALALWFSGLHEHIWPWRIRIQSWWTFKEKWSFESESKAQHKWILSKPRPRRPMLLASFTMLASIARRASRDGKRYCHHQTWASLICHPAKGIRQIAIIKLGTFAEMPFFSFLPKLCHFLFPSTFSLPFCPCLQKPYPFIP